MGGFDLLDDSNTTNCNTLSNNKAGTRSPSGWLYTISQDEGTVYGLSRTNPHRIDSGLMSRGAVLPAKDVEFSCERAINSIILEPLEKPPH